MEKLLNKITSEEFLREWDIKEEDLKNPSIKEKLDLLIDINREEIKRRCKNDALFLGYEILGYKDLNPNDFMENHPYRKIDKMLDRKGEYNKSFNLILMPRDTLKTTFATITKTIQRIIRDGNVRILITNAVMDNARKMLHEIKWHLNENPKFISIFGSLKGKIWREDEITVSSRTINTKEFTIEIGSPEKTKTSKHYDYIIADDLVTRENIKSSESKYSIYKYFMDLLDLLDHPQGVIDIIGTRWDFGDLYSQILDPINNHLDDFNIAIYKPYDENGELLFPKKLDYKTLDRLKRNKDTLEFSAQYLNEPVSSKDAIFKEEYFKNNIYDEIIEDFNNKYYILCDPANSKKKKSDYSGIIVLCVIPTGEWCIVDIVNDKLAPDELINKIFNLCKKYNPFKVGIETTGYFSYISKDIENKMIKENVFYNLIPLEPHNRKKEDRIIGLEPLIKYNRILFPRKKLIYVNKDNIELDMIYVLKDQFIKFPRGKNDDLIDALAYGLDIISPFENQNVNNNKIINNNKFKTILEEKEYEAKNKEWQNLYSEEKEPQYIDGGFFNEY